MLSSVGGGGGQSLEDKLFAFKYFISGQAISFVVLKATTTELIGPKKKHLNYLVNLTNEPNVSIPSLVKHLMRRARHHDWTVSFKSTITIHHLMSYGNEKFIQNLASSTVNHRSFDYLCSFSDMSTSVGYHMSIFLRRYARYINAKILTYRSLGIDFCRVKQPKNISLDQLMKILPVLQNQFDILLAFDASSEDLCNGIINCAFAMLYKDFVRLYITYQTAVIRLLELYLFVNQIKRAREMLDAYKKFLVRMNKVSDFMRVIDSVGLDKSDMPNMSRSPSVSLKLLEKHIENLESLSKRTSGQPTPTMGRLQSVELPRLDYATLGRPRRRSLRTPTRQTSLDILSPMAVARSHKRRADELSHLDQMLGFDKKKKDCDLVEQNEDASMDLMSTNTSTAATIAATTTTTTTTTTAMSTSTDTAAGGVAATDAFTNRIATPPPTPSQFETTQLQLTSSPSVEASKPAKTDPPLLMGTDWLGEAMVRQSSFEKIVINNNQRPLDSSPVAANNKPNDWVQVEL